VASARHPSLVHVAADAARAAEIAAELRRLGASTASREGAARYQPTLGRKEALEEETTAFFDFVARDNPESYDLIIERAVQRKAELELGTGGEAQT
jgi:hypothetical protein